MTFNQFLKQERLKRALTQEEMAKKLGVSYNWYVMVELGKGKPGVTFISKVAKLTRRSTKYIYSLLNNEKEN